MVYQSLAVFEILFFKIYTENIDRLHLLTGYKSDGGGWLCRTRDGWTQPTRVHGKHDSTP